ncbi:hypothetical protein BG452_18295 [Streptomyces sp. CBMA123]|nr:hypothetical protein [Streptomyces sp. CBMA123]
MESTHAAGNRSSSRLRAAHERKRFTGETLDVALAGLGRGNVIALDTCSPGQRSLRALLALGLFNDGPIGGRGGAWGWSRLSVYDPVMSPRWDELVIVAERAPDNVSDLLVSKRDQNSLHVPGLRLSGRSVSHPETFHLRHEATGARLVVTGRPSGPRCDAPLITEPWRGLRMSGDELTEAERDALDGLSPITPDAEVLLAGLVSRYTLEDREENWATSWDWDPLDRPGDRRRDAEQYGRGVQRRLSGRGDSWELRWTGYPYPADLARALTHPVVGIDGSALDRHRDTFEVTYGGARLELREGI